jgi:pimeloyl-ACP methyl ester carboxylesterase
MQANVISVAMPGHAVPKQDLYLCVEGARLRYRDTGAGPAVVLIHGWTLDLDMWEPLVPALAETFRVIRFDRRGFGLSSGKPSLASDEGDVLALYGHLGIARAALVGMSQAARVVVQLAAKVPARASCLVLDGAPAGIAADGATADPELPIAEYRRLMRDGGIEAFRRSWVLHPMTQVRSFDPDVRALVARMLARYRGEDLLEAQAIQDPPTLESIRRPALLIAGEFDVASRRAAAEAIARRLPCAQVVTIPDAGHLANLDNPLAYGAALSAFLQRHAMA